MGAALVGEVEVGGRMRVDGGDGDGDGGESARRHRRVPTMQSHDERDCWHG